MRKPRFHSPQAAQAGVGVGVVTLKIDFMALSHIFRQTRNLSFRRTILRNNPRRSLSGRSSPLAKASINDLSHNDEEVASPSGHTSLIGERTPKKNARNDSKRKSRAKSVTGQGEVLSDVLEGDLPPLDKWRKYFPLEKASVRRCAVRKPETAAMLAEAFVPEGSKDKIIIEASPGM